MHLIFERSRGRFKSNCNILALAWMPYYDEIKFRQALFDYHQKQLINLTSSVARNQNPRRQNEQGAVPPPIGGDGSLSGANGGALEQQNQNRNVSAAANQQYDLKAQLNQYLNSRIAEFHQRYIYLNDLSRDGSNFALDASFEDKNAIKMCNELDSKYGRMPEFGWLVIGNISKIVGVTLTSTIAQPEPSQLNNDHDTDDLMQFHDPTPQPQSAPSSSPLASSNNPLMTSDCNTNNGANNGLVGTLCDAKLVQSTLTLPSDFEKNRPDRRSVRNNYNLRGHLDEVILVKWNELYQKLATIDSKGNVLIWCKINEKFTIQTPFYNRTKSVADFKWSNDGKTALICYTDSFILVGSSSGQRHWHSMLNLDDYHITCASWTPNDEQLLLGVSNGNVVVIDLPHSELTELVINPTNIRTMCWSSCEMTLKNLSKLSSPANNDLEFRPQSNRRNSVVVNHRRLSRDCSVFSRYRFCSQGPNNNAANNGFQGRREQVGVSSANEDLVERQFRPKLQASGDFKNEQRNLLAMDFSNNTIKLYDGGLDDQDPRTINVNLESYIMNWSSDGKVLAVAGFNIHTSAPSVGCLRCRYLNAIKFYDQQGQLIYEHNMKYTRYPITAFTWAHADTRLFIATGPRLHCAKVFTGIPSLNLLTISCFQRYTRLPDKSDILENILNNNFDLNIINWQSRNCPIDLKKEFKQQRPKMNFSADAKLLPDLITGASAPAAARPNVGNNSNVFQYKLPSKLQTNIDDLFSQTIRQPYDENWSLNDIIWHVPKNDQRYYCTLVCYTSDRDVSSTGYQYRTEFIDRMSDNHATDQNKIFILYVEFQGSLIPILRARRVGFLKPEFVIFDPEDNQLGPQRQRKVSDVSHQLLASNLLERQLKESNNRHQSEHLSDLIQQNSTSINSMFHYDGGYSENYTNLHLYPEPRASASSSMGRQSMSDVEQYYNFECDTVNRKNQNKMAELISDRSHHQEPIALPMSSNPYLLYLMSMTGHHKQSQSKTSIMTGSPASRSTGLNLKRNRTRYKMRRSGLTSSLSETSELVRIKSNIWGTKFKLLNVGNRMIRQRSVLGSVIYKASILHLQPRQIFLNIKDMSNYCCLCSRHHHSSSSRAKSHALNSSTCCNVYDNKVSLLDMPNLDSPHIKPARHNSNKLSSTSKSRRSKKGQDDIDKVVLQVGDSIKIAPKLDLNQKYKFAGTFIVDNQKPSTSKGANGSYSSSNSAYNSENSSPRNESLNRGRHRFRGHSRSNAQPIVLKPETYHSSETHSSKSSNCKSEFKETYHHPPETVHSANSIVSKDDSQDDILTLSLSQSDEVKIEMSSLVDIRNENKVTTNKTQQLPEDSKSKKHNSNAGMEDFLATNKTLKSIQTITKMIVDLSSKANDSGEEEEQDIGCGEEELSSPNKLVKLSDERASNLSAKAKRYVPPDTPVHRPRRMASRLPRDDAILQTQSATTTPLKMFTSHKNHKGGRLDRNYKPQETPSLPPPPPPVPIRRRLSSSAKRFFDGSLRSLYGGGGGSHLGSDLEPEENEPLIIGKTPTKSGPKEVAWRFLGQSQPCTPAKSYVNSNQKAPNDLTSLRTQLIHRLRGHSNKDNIGCNINDKGADSNNTRTKSHYGSSNQLDKKSRGKTSWNDRFSRRGTSTSNFNDLVSSSDEDLSSVSSSDEESSESDDFNKSRQIDHNKLESKGKSKFSFSNSAKDLREFDPFKTRQDARVDPLKRDKVVVSGHRRRRHRRKSICPNTACCCAKEFKLNNRPPVWNELSQVYQLDFGGRVTQESAKNLQIDFDGNLALQFGRIDRCTYTLDYKYPFNAVQAMAIALASLTQRLK